MRNLVPHFILEKYAQGESGGRFQAAGLFADISGFGAATHALIQHGSEAAETMAEIMRALLEPLVGQVHAQGGFITTFAGDAFTALFPGDDPSACRRALAAALAIQQHIIAHPVQTTPYGRFPFAIRLGLGHGEAEWGILRPARVSTPRAQNAAYFFGGPAVEAAAAAEHLAQAGNLVLSAAIYAQVQGLVRALPLADGHWRCLLASGELPVPQAGPAAAPQDAAAALAEEAFVPSAVRQHESSGDFRPVVTVFCQLRGIETRQDLDIFMQAVFDLLHRFDGYLGRVDFGDKGCNLLLHWGMPTSLEHDVERACEFVLELGNHTPGTFRAGLTYAPMYAGVVGSAERGEYTCYGDGVNLAARLMQAAPWGSTWLDERLAGRARRRFVIEHVDDLAFKGFPEKQAVYSLVERRPPGESFFTGRMVGRQAELAELSAFVEPLLAASGDRRFGGVLVVVGEAGLGKSRLVHEFQSQLTAAAADSQQPDSGVPEAQRTAEIAGCQFFLCQTDPVLRQPLNPFRYWLQHYFDQSPAQSAERNKRAFSRRLDQVIAAVGQAALAQELERTRSCLGALVGLEWESSLYARLDAPGRHENTLQALKALLQAESLRRPAVLVLEDAQWLDEESQEFLRRLDRELGPCPLAVLATARPERQGELLGAGAPYRQLELGCLGPAELAGVAADRLGGPAAPELLELLTARAESNPFFAEQILLYLREQGRLECREGTWGLVGRSGEMPLPDEVRSIFSARLDRLTEEVRAVVQAAAILGREFEVRVLAAVLRVDEGGEQPGGLAGLVAVAEREAIWSTLSELRCLFKHALLRDAAYGMQLQAQRRRLHRCAAEALERLYSADLAPHDGEIAHHFEAACRHGEEESRLPACEYLERAGRRAAQRYENAAAVDWFSRALALAPAEQVERRLRLLLGREEVHHLLGQREAQRADLQTLGELARPRQQPAELAELALRQARLAQAVADHTQAQAQAQEAVALAQAAGAVEMEARAQLEWGVALWRQGDLPGGQVHGQAGLLLAEAAACPDLQGRSLNVLGNLARSQLDFAAAQRYFAQALAIHQQVGNRMGEGIALNNMGNVANDQDDHAAARRAYEQSLAVCREIGDRQGEAAALNNLGNAVSGQDDYAAARRYYEQGLAVYRQVGDRRGEIIALANLGGIAESQGDYAAARRHYEPPLDIYRELGNRRGESLVLSNLGGIIEKQGDYAAARRHYDQALALARESDTRRGEAIALRHLGELSSTEGDYAAARRYLEQALAAYREIDNREGEAQTLGLLGDAASRQADHGAAQHYLEQALALYRQVGIPKDEALLLQRLAQGALARGDHAAARQHAEQMLAIGRRIGSRRTEGLALHLGGRVANAQGDHAAARRSYAQALAIRQDLALAPDIAESLVELAQVDLALGDLEGARAGMREVLPILAANPHLDGIDHPRRALLSCARVLQALQDPRGAEILTAAHARLQEQAAQLEGEAARKMFLEDVPENRELVADWARLSAPPAAPAGERPAPALAPREDVAPAGRPGERKQKKADRKAKQGGRDRQGKEKKGRKGKKDGKKGKKD